MPGMVPIMSASGSAWVDGLFRLAGSRIDAFDQVVEDGDADIGEQQRGDGLVDAALVAQRAGEGDPGRRPPACRPPPCTSCTTSGGATFATGRPAAIAASPPMTNAPSPPMTIRPACAGSAVHSAVSISGEASVSVFCTENQVPNEPSTMLL